MWRNLLVTFFLGMSVGLLAQNSGNPFDLKFRPSKKIEVVKPVKPDTSAIKPFPDSSKIKELQKKTYEDTSILSLGSEKQDSLTKLSSGNPFEKKTAADSALDLVNPLFIRILLLRVSHPSSHLP
jgi:hypothetical protein